MNPPRYDWSLVSPETAQKVLQAAHDYEKSNPGLQAQGTYNTFCRVLKQAQDEAAVYEVTADEQNVLCTAQAYYRAHTHRRNIHLGELNLGTRMDIEDGCLSAFMKACEKAAPK